MSEAMIIRKGGSKKLQSKTVTPSTSQQNVTPDSGYDGLDSVTVKAITPTKAAQTYTPGTSNQTIASGRWLTGTQTIKGDANLAAANIKKGVSIFNVTGTYAGELSKTNAILSVRVVIETSTPSRSVRVFGNGYDKTSSTYFTEQPSGLVYRYFFPIPPKNFGTFTVRYGTSSTYIQQLITVNSAGSYYELVFNAE